MIRGKRHRAFTFVELVGASVILAIAIVPATQYLTDSMALRRRLERDGYMVALAIQTIEQQMAVINGGFTTTQEVGTFASQGLPEIAYEVTRTDATIEGGTPDLVMVITVRVWADTNANSTVDPGESVVELNTKMARSIES